MRLALDPNGVPYVFYRDNANGNKATVMRFVNGAWSAVGPVGFSSGALTGPALSIALDPQGTPYVAYEDGAQSNALTVKRFNSSTAQWVTVGTEGFSAGPIQYPDISIDSTGVPYVVYMDNAISGKITVKQWNGTAWVTLGTDGFSVGRVVDPNVLIDSTNTLYVVYYDGGLGDKAIMKKFDRATATWVTVGPEGFSPGTVHYLASTMSASGTPYVAFRDTTVGDKITVMQLN